MTRERFYLYGGISIMVLAVVIIGFLPAKQKEQTREVEVTVSPEKIEELRQRFEHLETLRYVLFSDTFQRLPADIEKLSMKDTSSAP